MFLGYFEGKAQADELFWLIRFWQRNTLFFASF